MNLQDKVLQVKKVNENLLIVEFSNGYAIAYEKGTNEERIISQIFPPDRSFHDSLEWQIKCGLGLEEWNSVSREMQDLFRTYTSSSYKQMKDIIQKTMQLQDDLIKQLKIKETAYMNITKGLPPVYPLFFLPLLPMYLAANIASELIHPTGRTHKITNKKNLIITCDGKNPAIYDDVMHDNNFFLNPNFINDSQSLCLLFPPSETYKKFIFLGRYEPTTKKPDNKTIFNKYKNSAYFLRVDKTVCQEVSDLVKQRDTEYVAWQNFKESLNKENQRSLLKHLKFIV